MAKVGAIAIGRNEGARLEACLASLQGVVSPIVYVDSGSSDGSVALACGMGAEVVQLDMSRPFTAARARNSGLAHLTKTAPEAEFVLFLDGDCTLVGGFIEAALTQMEQDEKTAVVCGRRREKFPEASLWNRMIDAEWDTPVGLARACGGDALMRIAALAEVEGYQDDLIAGEEPEMCFRLRKRGWNIHRIAAEMTAHDAALTRFSQWWQRSKRAGHAYGEGAALHGAEAPEHYNRKEQRRILFWGAVLPFLALLGCFISFWALALLLLWPLQVLRLKAKGSDWHEAFFLTLGKLSEAQGIFSYWRRRLLRQDRRLIEYK